MGFLGRAEGLSFVSRVRENLLFPAQITFNCPYFDPATPVEEQMDILREDMFQTKWSNGLTQYVGWYPRFDRDGRFRLVVAKNADWDAPLAVLR